MQSHGRPLKKRRRAQGFSSPGQRQLWDLIFRSEGINGREKRNFLNQIASTMVFSAAITGAVLGFVWFGIGGGVIAFGLGAVLMGKWVTKNRYYR